MRKLSRARPGPANNGPDWITQRKPRWPVEVSTASRWRAAGRWHRQVSGVHGRVLPLITGPGTPAQLSGAGSSPPAFACRGLTKPQLCHWRKSAAVAGLVSVQKLVAGIVVALRIAPGPTREAKAGFTRCG